MIRNTVSLFLCFVHLFLYGQTFLFKHSLEDSAFVCGKSRVKIELENVSSGFISNLQFQIFLPGGTSYVPGSIVNASELNLNIPHEPVFSLNNFQSAEKRIILLDFEMGCDLFDQVNSGILFRNKIVLQHSAGIDSFRSDPPYRIETGFLLITNVRDTVVEAGTSLKRIIRIINSRLGPIRQFIFSDLHDPIKLTSTSGSILLENDQNLQLLFSAADFTKIGDRDSLFERDEFIEIEELITDSSCLARTHNSDFEVNWGCKQAICQSDIENAEINFTQPSGNARMVFSIDEQVPECSCDPEGVVFKMNILNIGNRKADSLTIELMTENPSSVNDLFGFLIDSFRIEGNASIRFIQVLDPYDGGSCNLLPKAERILLQISGLHPGQEINLLGRIIINPIFNGNRFSVYYNYRYTSNCNNRVTANSTPIEKLINLDHSKKPSHAIRTTLPNNLLTGSFDLIDSVVLPQKLNTETLKLRILIPCGFTLRDSTFFFAGKTPFSSMISRTNRMIIDLSYAPPFEARSYILRIPLTVDCDAPCLSSFDLQSFRYHTTCVENKSDTAVLSGLICSDLSLVCYDKDGCSCGPNLLALFGFDLDCVKPSENSDTIPGYISFNSGIYRHNIYLEDKNGNRIYDGTGQAKRSDVIQTNFITNDTLVNFYNADIISDFTGFLFDSVSFLLQTELILQPLNTILRYYNASLDKWFELTSDTLIKKYNSSNSSPGCGDVRAVIEKYGSGYVFPLTFEFIKSQFNLVNIPGFGERDQFIIQSFYVNPGNVNDRIYTTNCTNYAFLFSRQNAYTKVYSCHKETHTIKLATLGLQAFLPPREMMLCNNRLQMEPLVIQGNRKLDDFFNFEFRPLTRIDSIKYLLPDGIELDTLWIYTSYQFESSSYRVRRDHFVPVKSGNVYSIRVDQLKEFLWDESHILECIPHFKMNNCTKLVSENIPIIFQYYISAIDSNVFWIYPDLTNLVHTYQISSGTNYTINNPGKKIQFIQKELYISSRELFWDLLYPVEHESGYLKIELESANGTADQFNLSAIPPITVVKLNPQCFLIGPFLSDTTYLFNLSGIEKSCDKDTLIIHSSWSCDSLGLARLIDTCLRTRLEIPVIPANPELELDIVDQQKPVFLCDTVPEIVLEFFNAGKGAAYDTKLFVDIPDGIRLLPNTLMISYPAGSAFVPLSMPDHLGGNTYFWKLDAVLPQIAQSGLPGIQYQPENSILIKFKSWVDCNFIPGRYFIFTATGLSPCENATNTLRKAGRNIEISGIHDKPASRLKLNILPPAACEDSLTTVRVSIWPQQISGSQDSCLIVFPDPLQYVANSFKPLSNMLFQIPLLTKAGNSSEIRLKIPENVPKDSAVIFAFDLASWNELPCGKYPITLESFTRSEAYCKESQVNCAIRTAASSASDTLDRQLTNVRLDQWTLSWTLQNGLESEVKIQADHLLLFREDSLCFGIYADRGIPQKADPPDTLIGILKLKIPTGKDSLDFLWQHQFKFPPGKYCRFIMLPLNNSCICQTDTLFSSLPEQMEFVIRDSLCFGDSLFLTGNLDSIGNFIWLRSPDTCTTCFHQWFRHNGQTSGKDSFLLELRTEDSCIQKLKFDIDIFNPVQSQKQQQEYCPNEEIELNAGKHKIYSWQGKDIDDPKAYIQRIKLSESRLYLLHFEDSLGCVGTDTFDLIIDSDSSRYRISADTTIKQGDAAQLYTDPGYTYEWFPPDDLSCSDCPTPIAKPNQSTRYYLIITDSMGCKHQLSVLVRVLITDCEQTVLGIPNAFSPNGDQINDYFSVRSENLENFHLRIANRWGEIVFESSDQHVAWDGSYLGKLLNPDVYAYYLRFDCQGRTFYKKGNVSLLK
ncbi:MAG: gliding motility-associated C-terminal domain-containing protein [Saprospiraceae bacterium]|nr:gliding motility-associated C-terminal domain-containing protein [Saprospiraceae bacterium]